MISYQSTNPANGTEGLFAAIEAFSQANLKLTSLLEELDGSLGAHLDDWDDEARTRYQVEHTSWMRAARRQHDIVEQFQRRELRA